MKQQKQSGIDPAIAAQFPKQTMIDAWLAALPHIERIERNLAIRLAAKRTATLTGTPYQWSQLLVDGDWTEQEPLYDRISAELQSANPSLSVLSIRFTEVEARFVMAQADDVLIDIKPEDGEQESA